MIKPERAVWILAIFYFLLNLGLLSAKYNFDGTVFSLHLEMVKAGGSFGLLLHPRHLLYEPLGYLFWNLLWLFGLKIRSFLALEIFDLAISSLCLAVFALNLVLLQPKRKFSALFFALGLGFCWGWWFLSVEPEVYILAVLVLNLSFYFMLRSFSSTRISQCAVWLSLLASLCLFSHLAYSLFWIPLIYFLARVSPGKWLKKFYPALMTLTLAFVLSASVYLLAFHLNPLAQAQSGARPEKFMKWFFGLALSETPYGYEQSYWNLSLSAFPQWLDGIWSCFWGKDSLAESALWLNSLRIYSLGVLVSCILAYIYFYLREWGKRDLRCNLIWLWLIPGALFTILWEPANYEHKLYFLPALWMMAFLGFDKLGSLLNQKFAIFIFALAFLILFIINLQTRIIPGANPENNRELKLALMIRDLTLNNGVIVISGARSGNNIQKIYIPYFAQRNTIVLDWVLSRRIDGKGFPENLRKIIKDKLMEGKPVYVLSEALQGPALDELSSHHKIQSKALQEFWDQFQLKPIFQTEGVMVYQVI